VPERWIVGDSSARIAVTICRLGLNSRLVRNAFAGWPADRNSGNGEIARGRRARCSGTLRAGFFVLFAGFVHQSTGALMVMTDRNYMEANDENTG
jgi:hypothetical protein